MSVASAMLIAVLLVAGHQEIQRNRQAVVRHDERLGELTAAGRVLVLVVTNGERDAVLRSVRDHVGQDATLDYVGARTVYTLGSVEGTEVLLAQAGEQGTAPAAGMLMTAHDVIEQCRPDYVVLVGICFGLRPDEGQHIGDIIVARRVHNTDHRKLTDGDNGRDIINRGANVGCSPKLLDRFQAAGSTWAGPRVHFGTVLTSNTLMNSKSAVIKLRTKFPDAIAGEMEGSGVHEASTLSVKPDWILVKATSDWGYGKSNNAQPQAAKNAADYVTHVVASGALRQRPPHRSPSSP